MRIGRLVGASLVLFVVAVLWNGFVHLVVLRDLNASLGAVYLQRPDLSDFLWLSLVMTLGVAVLFVWGYGRFAREGSLREGVGYGVFFALLAGLFVDLNQYVLYPLPASAPLAWFMAGFVEFVLYGVLVTRLYPVSRPG